MATFPALRPSSREFSIGEYPIKTYQSLSGKTVRRIFGNKPYNYSLSLEFANVEESTLSGVMSHYHGQQGAGIGFDLPSSIFSGYENSQVIEALQQAGTSSALWYYAEPPSVKSVYAGISTINIRLVSQL